MKTAAMFRDKRLLTLFLCSLAVRLIFWIFVLPHPERALDADSKGYLLLAEQLLDSHSFPSILRTPVYPFFIAVVYSFLGKFPQAVLLFQYLVDSFTAIIVVLLFFRLFQNVTYSVLAGFLYAVNPFSVFYSTRILSETVFTFLFTVAVYFFVLFLFNRRKLFLSVSSLLLGIAVLCRPIAFYTPLLLVPCIFFAGYALKDRMRNVLIFLMVFFAVLLPWYAKNHAQYGRWTLSTIADFNWFIDFAPEVLMVREDPLSVITLNVNERIRPFQMRMWNAAREKYGWNEESAFAIGNDAERYSLMREEGLKVIYDSPSLFILSHSVSIARVLCPYYPPFHIVIGRNIKVLTLLCFVTDILIMGLFVFGVLLSLRERGMERTLRFTLVLMAILIVYFSFVPGIVGYSRFRIPVLPYISIFSALGAQKVLARVRPPA